MRRTDHIGPVMQTSIEKAVFQLVMTITQYADATAQIETPGDRAMLTGHLDEHRQAITRSVMSLLLAAGLIS